MIRSYKYRLLFFIFFVAFLVTGKPSVYAQHSANDTITSYAVIYNGDTIEAKTLPTLGLDSKLTEKQRNDLAKWTRLRNAVYVTYPYAKRAGAVLNDMMHTWSVSAGMTTEKNISKSREKDLKREFTTPLTNLSVYQGKVLMKLINRETGNNCYEIIKEYKGGLTARFYQTVAFFFSSNLKQPYDRAGDDAEIKKIVQEVQRMYGWRG